jgi:flagellar assembly protein FliH
MSSSKVIKAGDEELQIGDFSFQSILLVDEQNVPKWLERSEISPRWPFLIPSELGAKGKLCLICQREEPELP